MGAADGYYAVGMVRSGLCPKATCFEMTVQDREVISSNAQLNGVDRRITIRATAHEDFLDEIPSDCWSDERPAVFLFDTEGAEFDLLTDDMLTRLSSSRGIVELHAPLEDARVMALIDRAKRHFTIDLMRMGERDPSALPMLSEWPDDDRWLLCSESRPHVMHWMVFTPR